MRNGGYRKVSRDRSPIMTVYGACRGSADGNIRKLSFIAFCGNSYPFRRFPCRSLSVRLTVQGEADRHGAVRIGRFMRSDFSTERP